MKTIDQSVNQALNNIELLQNEDFADLMSALYSKLEEAENASHFDFCNIVEEIKDAIGHFVSTS